MNIQEALDQIEATWTFDRKSYPSEARLTRNEEFRFAVNHMLLHMQKSSGKIATALEEADHGAEINHREMITASLKQLMNSFRLCAFLGLTETEIVDWINDLSK